MIICMDMNALHGGARSISHGKARKRFWSPSRTPESFSSFSMSLLMPSKFKTKTRERVLSNIVVASGDFFWNSVVLKVGESQEILVLSLERPTWSMLAIDRKPLNSKKNSLKQQSMLARLFAWLVHEFSF